VCILYVLLFSIFQVKAGFILNIIAVFVLVLSMEFLGSAIFSL